MKHSFTKWQHVVALLLATVTMVTAAPDTEKFEYLL